MLCKAACRQWRGDLLDWRPCRYDSKFQVRRKAWPRNHFSGRLKNYHSSRSWTMISWSIRRRKKTSAYSTGRPNWDSRVVHWTHSTRRRQLHSHTVPLPSPMRWTPTVKKNVVKREEARATELAVVTTTQQHRRTSRLISRSTRSLGNRQSSVSDGHRLLLDLSYP